MMMSATNPLGLGRRPPSNTRQKTTLNSDLPSDLMGGDMINPKTAASKGSKAGGLGSKARLPMPPKRGNSLGPGRLKTQSAADLSGIKGLLNGGRMTPSGAGKTGAADSTAFS